MLGAGESAFHANGEPGLAEVSRCTRTAVASKRPIAPAGGMGKREVNMFVQVIQGHVSDAAQVRVQLDRWVEEVAPGAVGWLGSTSGVTDDGRLVALARFELDEAARRNSDRPEQTAWWEQTATLFTDEPVFHDSTSVEVDTPGDPSQALRAGHAGSFERPGPRA